MKQSLLNGRYFIRQALKKCWLKALGQNEDFKDSIKKKYKADIDNENLLFHRLSF